MSWLLFLLISFSVELSSFLCALFPSRPAPTPADLICFSVDCLFCWFLFLCVSQLSSELSFQFHCLRFHWAPMFHFCVRTGQSNFRFSLRPSPLHRAQKVLCICGSSWQRIVPREPSAFRFREPGLHEPPVQQSFWDTLYWLSTKTLLSKHGGEAQHAEATAHHSKSGPGWIFTI